MLARAVTHALVGLEPRRVEVEASVSDTGLPAFVIVGLPDRACAEARQRVRSGIHSAELRFPHGPVTVNLAPAGLRKEGKDLVRAKDATGVTRYRFAIQA